MIKSFHRSEASQFAVVTGSIITLIKPLRLTSSGSEETDVLVLTALSCDENLWSSSAVGLQERLGKESLKLDAECFATSGF